MNGSEHGEKIHVVDSFHNQLREDIDGLHILPWCGQTVAGGDTHCGFGCGGYAAAAAAPHRDDDSPVSESASDAVEMENDDEACLSLFHPISRPRKK